MNNKVVKLLNNYTKKADNANELKKREKRVVRNRIGLFGGLMSLIAIVLTVIIINQNIYNADLSHQLVETEAVLEERIETEEDLQQQIKQLNDDNYIIRIARSEFNLSDEDEIIFNFANEDE